jgi:hypothetical protein
MFRKKRNKMFRQKGTNIDKGEQKVLMEGNKGVYKGEQNV